MKRLTAFVVLSLLVLSSSFAWAKDCGNGVATCACGDKVVADWTLSANMTCSTTNGLRVGSGVVLDGNHKSLTGTGSAQVGILIEGNGATIMLFDHITGFDQAGVAFAGNSAVYNNHLYASGMHNNGSSAGAYGVDIRGGSGGNRVNSCTIYNNGDEGIHAGTGSNVIEWNDITNHPDANIYLVNSNGNSIHHNFTSGGGNNVYIKDSDDNVLADNEWENRPFIITHNSDGNQSLRDKFYGVYTRLLASGSLVPNNNIFDSAQFRNASGICVESTGATGNTIWESDFGVDGACATDVKCSGTGTINVYGSTGVNDLSDGASCTINVTQ